MSGEDGARSNDSVEMGLVRGADGSGEMNGNGRERMVERVCGEISPVRAYRSWQRCSCSTCVCVCVRVGKVPWYMLVSVTRSLCMEQLQWAVCRGVW